MSEHTAESGRTPCWCDGFRHQHDPGRSITGAQLPWRCPREPVDGPEFSGDDAPTVCLAHGRFIPCRSAGEHRYTSNRYWVKSVRDYQQSTNDALTWEPAWESPVPPEGSAP